MTQLEKRAEQIARARQELTLRLIAARLREDLRQARVEILQSEIHISGAGLFKRWLTETGLRFVGDLVK
jgi:hypothetical protein